MKYCRTLQRDKLTTNLAAQLLSRVDQVARGREIRLLAGSVVNRVIRLLILIQLMVVGRRVLILAEADFPIRLKFLSSFLVEETPSAEHKEELRIH